MTGKVIPLKPSEMNPQTASQIIREIAAETSRVVILDHARRRMRRRRISPTQVYSCIRMGVITEGPSQDMKGYWRCTMQRFAAGEEITIVVSFNSRESLLVITVY
ncbi:MAG: DUF4258 domain-containing protein [Proteobacteria bacterium]|nr:DUF4258 domain-containing protein [Pseudomonadota bacterium]MCH7957242.1 DUF4258 domain-containing protein [Pseudomonadota bacterium]